MMTTTKVTDVSLPRELFQTADKTNQNLERISRPTLSYWQDALRRLARNKIAVISFATIVLVGLAGLIGPLFFPAEQDGISYENQQNADFINDMPNIGRDVKVIDDNWQAPEVKMIEMPAADPGAKGPLMPPSSIKVLDIPTVNGVTLEWTPVPGATGYTIFRTVGKNLTAADVVSDPDLRGMTVANITEPGQVTITDSSSLDAGLPFIYSIVSLRGEADAEEPVMSETATVVETSVARSIRLSAAQAIQPDVQVGDMVRTQPKFFGMDRLGRDIFARMMQGTRVDFFLALIIPTICMLLGILYGATSGLLGGKVDLILMRVIEVLDSMPELLFLILFQVVLGKGVSSLIIALCAFGWTGYARLLRGEVLRLREAEFVHASRLLGAPLLRLIGRHLAPNLLGLLIVLWSSNIPRVIAAEAFLSLLGLGIESPDASWGTVLQDAGQQFQDLPQQFFFPSLVMGVTLLAFYLLGDALRDAFDPKLRGRE